MVFCKGHLVREAEPHRPDPGRRYIHGCARLMTKERALVGVPNVI